MTRTPKKMSALSTIDSIYFSFYERPVAKERARNNFHTPKRTRAYEELVRKEGQKAMGNYSPMNCPLEVHFWFTFTIPTSWPLAKKALAASKLIFPSKSDVDNLAKAVSDGLNGVVWYDDSQINHLVARAFYGEIDEVYVKASKNGYDRLEVDKYLYEAKNGKR